MCVCIGRHRVKYRHLMERAEESASAAAPAGQPTSVLSEQLRMVSAPVYLAVMLFSMSTWIAIVGVWVEMPLLVNALPESWKLPSYLVIIIQCANLGPATYAIWDKMRQRNRQASDERQHQQQQQQQHPRIDAEVVVSFIIIFVAIMSVVFLSLFWNHTMVVDSVNRSVVLLTLVSFASLSSCTSSVVFLPYMVRFPSVYISAYYFGQGLCGLIPGFLGLAQVAGHEPQCRNETENSTGILNSYDEKPRYIVYYDSPRFSVSAFCALISVLLCVSLAAFCCLNFVQKCRSQMIVSASAGQLINADRRERLRIGESRDAPDSDAVQTDVILLQRRRFVSLFVTIGVVSALMNGVLPATQTYSCLPYGNIVYRLSVCLSSIMSPLATLPNMFAPTSSVLLITGLGVVALLLSSLHLVLAAQSPHPILQGSVIGQVIVVSHCLQFRNNCKVLSLQHFVTVGWFVDWKSIWCVKYLVPAIF